MSNITMYFSAMYGGKTSTLLQTAYNYEDRGKNVLIIKPSIDTKGDDTIVSSIGMGRKADILLSPEESLFNDHSRLLSQSDVILIDEAQFLTETQVDELWYLSELYGKTVNCYGLKTDFQGHFFPGSKRLFEIARTQEISTISSCECGQKAEFNARCVDGEYTLSGSQVAIDGEANIAYNPLCPKCYLEKVVKVKKKVLKR